MLKLKTYSTVEWTITLDNQNTEHLGTSEVDRSAVFDMYCENEKGEKILIEMQRGEQQFFKAGRLYYSTFPIQEYGQQGEWNNQFKAVYVIGVLNFIYDDSHDNYFHHEVKLMDTQSKEVFYDKLTFVYLEMPKFNKTEDQLETLFDKWLFVLRNLTRLFDRPAALQERVFTRLFETAEISKFTKTQLEAYEDSLKVYRDWKNTIDSARYRGKEEGKKELISKMMNNGASEELICQFLAISPEELKSLLKD